MNRIEADVERLAIGLLDGVADEATPDLVAALSAPLPIHTISPGCRCGPGYGCFLDRFGEYEIDDNAIGWKEHPVLRGPVVLPVSRSSG